MKKILLISDSTTNMFLLESILSKEYDVLVCELNSLEKQVSEINPNIILIDYVYNEDIVEIFSSIKNIPIIFVSIICEETLTAKISKLQNINYLQRPVLCETIIEKIEQII